VVQYRSFRNTDPPHLVEIWNESFNGRGFVHLRHSNPLERHAFAKPYFDPAGLIIAEDNQRLVGFAHAGFGPNLRETALSTRAGVTCLLAVRPPLRRHGIGSELLNRCEAYLRERGAREFYAGPMRPLTPFYFGLYGGCDLAGFLDSDTEAGPFLLKHGYRPEESQLIFQRRLDEPLAIADARFSTFRRRYDLKVLPRIALGTWWQECVLGLTEPVEFRLEEKGTTRPVARAIAWEMEGYSWRWNQPAVGLLDVQVAEGLRRQGVGKFLLTQIMRYLQDQFFGVAEIHAPESNATGVAFLNSLGFEQVDTGRLYKKA
jgi:ribosomal protein S18 acetylase RimI-like enzyme